MANEQRRELLPGTLEMLILQTLKPRPLHGYGIAQFIRKRSGKVLEVGEGSLYPALQRLRVKGYVDAEWGLTDTGRRARFYNLTGSGKARLEHEINNFQTLLEAIAQVMQPI